MTNTRRNTQSTAGIVTLLLLTSLAIAACSEDASREAASATPAASETAAPEPSEERPNILILLADDMGFGDIGSFGSEIETPNIDSLAADGIRFTNFHVGAACSPTRTMLMTGVDNHLAGMGNMTEIQADNQFGKPGYEGRLNDKVVTVATLLRKAGYHTYMAGKWHLGKTPETIPYARGFERSYALMESGADNWQEMPYAPLYKAVHYFEDAEPVSLPQDDYYSTVFYTDKVIEYIDSNQDDDQPWFAYLSFQAVHYPHQAPREFIDKYNGVYDAGWNVLRKKRLARQRELGVVSADAELQPQFDDTTFAGWKIPDWDSLSDEEKRFNARRMQTYAGMVDAMDTNIGRLLAHLEATGEAENTLVIFHTDNGADPNLLPQQPAFRAWYAEHYPFTYEEDYDGNFEPMGQKGSYSDYGAGWAAAANTPTSDYKTFSSEGGLRVPFVARFPGKVPAGQTTTSFGYVKDIVPTLLEVAGAAPPGDSFEGRSVHPISGTSMWPVMTGQASQVHPASETIGYELAGSSAVFKGSRKLVRNLPPKGNGNWELYDIVADPSEMHDLAGDMPELTEELIAAYAAYVQSNNVIEVPDDYDPLKQVIKNATRGH